MDSLAAAPGTGPATSPLPTLRPPRKPASFEKLPTDRAVVFGILNVTPDSFSDGGSYNSLDTAIAHGLRMFYAGADVIDIGGESTRPGADEVDPVTEQERIMPVVEAMVKAGALVSVDTRHAETAAKALDAGAAIINDISGMSVTPEMVALVAERKVPYVLMHRRGDAKTMDSLIRYENLVGDVVTELSTALQVFYAAGVQPEQLIVDPGLGFSKTADQNWELLANLEQLEKLGHRVLVGTSRKRFLGSLLSTAGKAAAPTERDHATVATTAIAAGKGAWGVRVHDVIGNLHAVKVAARIRAAAASTAGNSTGSQD